jgi:hypothetical protein
VPNAVPDRLLTTPETATSLGLSPRSVGKLAEQGFLTRIKVLGATRYRASEVERLIREGTRGNPRQVG